MQTISRYLLRRHLAPFGLAFALLTLLMLGQQIAKQLPLLRGTGVPTSELVELFVVSLPFIVAVTLPMAVLVAVLWVFTRLAVDNEFTAMKARGLTVLRLMTPTLTAAACVAALAFVWNDQVVPRSNHRLRTLQVHTWGTPSSFRSDREMTIAELRRSATSAREDASLAAGDGSQAMERAARERAATYEVEIQKKYAVAAACVVFALVGAPVGLRFPRRGVGLVMGVSTGVYSGYYVGLIAGEELGDRLIESPFFAMWTPNLVFGAFGLVALWWISRRWSAEVA